MAQKTQMDRYVGIQVLRFVAAALVLVAHSTFVLSEKVGYLGYEAWRKGGVGVFLFFVISGFVMVLSIRGLRAHEDAWKIFAKRRLIRIVPMYWFAITLKVAAILAIPATTVHSGFEVFHTISSYLFIPARNPLGVITPVHAVGWTLNYEMFFYAMFTLALFLRRSPVLFTTTLFVLLVLTGLAVGDVSYESSIGIYTRPFILNFVLGMFIACICMRGYRLPAFVSIALIFVGVTSLAYSEGWGAYFGNPRRGLALGPTLIVAGVAFLEPIFRQYDLKLAQQLGDSSYSLYIFHPFILGALAVLFAALKWTNYATAILIMVLSSIAITWVIYKKVELPITQYLNRRFVRSSNIRGPRDAFS